MFAAIANDLTSTRNSLVTAHPLGTSVPARHAVVNFSSTDAA